MAVQLGRADISVIIFVFLVVIAKAIYVSYRASRDSKVAGVEAEDFFLAGRNMPFWAVGFSIFASNIGAEHFVGQAGEAASSGMPVSIYEWSAGLLIFFLGALTPTFLQLRLTTMPEYFERRFNAPCRALIASVSILIYVLTKIANSLFAGTVLFEVVLGLSMWVSAPVILVFTAAYAAAGGLSAVMYTDVGQAAIFLIGGAAGMLYALSEIGGVSEMVGALDRAELSWFMSTMRPADKLNFPWTGMMLGQPVASIWYWVVDQTMVQRIFSAKSVTHGQAGCVLAGFLKVLPPFLMVIPGIIARCFYEECKRTHGALYRDWCETALDEGNNANKAYPFLVVKTFPDGLRGLMVASMVLAMMSSLDSVFNCTSTVVTKDLYVRFINPDASHAKQVWVGRGVTLMVMVVGFLWLPMFATNADGLYLASQRIQAHLAPTLVAVFLLGLFWTRANGKGAFIGMVIGFGFGISRYIITLLTQCAEPDPFGRTGDEASLACMDFNHMALIIFAVAGTVTVVASLLTRRPPPEKVKSACTTASGFGDDHRHEGSTLVSLAMAVSGMTLLIAMLFLCVGFGYSDNPHRHPATWEELEASPGTDASFTGGEITVSGGPLSATAICIIISLVAIGAISAMCWAPHPELPQAKVVKTSPRGQSV